MSYPYKVPKEIDLNKLGDLYYPELDGMIEVATEEALKLYPEKDWRDVKLCLLQSLVNKVANKLLIHFRATKPSNADIDGDAILESWNGVMINGLGISKIKSECVHLVHFVERDGRPLN